MNGVFVVTMVIFVVTMNDECNAPWPYPVPILSKHTPPRIERTRQTIWLIRFRSLIYSIRMILQEGEGKVIAIVGVIGAGKSTACGKIKTNLVKMYHREGKVCIIPEPSIDTDKLVEFYYDPHRYAASFQEYMLEKRFDNIVRANELRDSGYIVILDMCLLFDKMYALVNKKFFNDDQWASYIGVYDNYMKQCGPVDYLIYLDASPIVCMNRIKIRGRECECDIPLSYLTELDTKCHKHYREVENDRRFTLNSIRIDWNSPFQSICDVLPNIF